MEAELKAANVQSEVEKGKFRDTYGKKQLNYE